MRKKLNSTEICWNRVILKAVMECSQTNIDRTFLTCEERLCELNAPEKEKALRLFALAFYCDKTYNWDFFKSAAFSRFAALLNDFYFEQTAKTLLEKENPALALFWAIFRLSCKRAIAQNRYLSLERKMKEKTLKIFLK